MKDLAARLISARTASGLNQTELAVQIGARQSVIGMLESGARRKTTYLTKIAKVLGVSPVWLDSGDGPRYAVAEQTADNYHPAGDDESILLRAYRMGSPDLRRSLLWQAQKILEDLDNPLPLTGTHRPECQ